MPASKSLEEVNSDSELHFQSMEIISVMGQVNAVLLVSVALYLKYKEAEIEEKVSKLLFEKEEEVNPSL